ncbi:MAG TPA: MarR family transcriptional regulator [Candidatus Limnocylindria bacterium]|nr:MarR family transcriptional regulator [Candidatus Limnocylindria bacterium]
MNNLEKQVVISLGEYGSCSVLLRNATSRKLGLNIADIECLSLLFLKGISTPTELARYTGLTTGSTTAMLDRLEKAELIKRKPNPKDRRGLLIEVNKNLKETLGPTFAGIQKVQNELIASYSDEELQAIADFLSRFVSNVKGYTKLIEKELA